MFIQNGVLDIDVMVSVDFTQEEIDALSEQERVAVIRLVQTIHRDTENGKQYKIGKRGGLVYTEAGRRCEQAAVYELIGDLDIGIPHSFAQDRISDILSLVTSKINTEVRESAGIEAIEQLQRERQRLIDDTVHTATLSRLNLEDRDYRQWARRHDDITIQRVLSAFEDNRTRSILIENGTSPKGTSLYDSLTTEDKTLVDQFAAIYKKKETGVRRRNMVAGEIKTAASENETATNPLSLAERSLFTLASQQVGEIDTALHGITTSLHRGRMLEGLEKEYGHVRDQQRMAELTRMFRIRTGETNNIVLHNMAKQRLADERRIHETLGLDESKYSVADRSRIITKMYDSWQIVKDDVAQRMMKDWDGQGEAPVTFTASGQLTEASNNKIFDTVNAELCLELAKMGINFRSPNWADTLEKKVAEIQQRLASERTAQIYGNTIEVRRLYQGKLARNIDEALGARHERVVRLYPQTEDGMATVKPKFTERISQKAREIDAGILDFMQSNKALKAFSLARLAVMAPALLASSAHFVDSVIDGLDQGMVDHLSQDLHTASIEMDQLLEQQINRLGQDMQSFGVETSPIFETETREIEVESTYLRERELASQMQHVPQEVIDRCLTPREVTLDNGETMIVMGYNPEAAKDGVCQIEFPGMKFALDRGQRDYEITYPEVVHVPEAIENDITHKDFTMNTERGATCLLTVVSSVINHIRDKHDAPGYQSWVFSEIAQKSAILTAEQQVEHSLLGVTSADQEASSVAKLLNQTGTSQNDIISAFNEFYFDKDGLIEKYNITFDQFDFSGIWGFVSEQNKEADMAAKNAFIDTNTDKVAEQIAKVYQDELDNGHYPIFTSYVEKGVGHATIVLGTRFNEETNQYELLVAEPNGGYTGWEYTKGNWQKVGDNGLVAVPLNADILKHTYISQTSFREATMADKSELDVLKTVETEIVQKEVDTKVSIAIPFTDVSYHFSWPTDDKMGFFDKIKYAWQHA